MQIVYFDGVCNLCNGFIDYLIRHDRKSVLRFAPLQGETARQRLPAEVVQSLSHVVYEDGKRRYVESTAVIRALASVSAWHKLFLIFLICPKFLRNFVYRWVAARRYRLWGQRPSCRLPTAEEATRFLP